jgi:hypothetical protein
MRHFRLRKEAGDFLKGKHGTLATLANFSNLGRSPQSGCLIGLQPNFSNFSSFSSFPTRARNKD